MQSPFVTFQKKNIFDLTSEWTNNYSNKNYTSFHYGEQPQMCQFFSSISVAIKPLVNMNTAHHLMVFGCPEPAKHAFASDGEYWYAN